MKTSLKKLLHHKDDPKEKRRRNPYSHVDELAQACQDMQDMKDCYDGLLSAAAATANSAYEFSEALKELGTCLLQRTALNDDEESGRVLLMIGKAQFELQKLVDHYRSHIFQTIVTPSDSLLNELRTVEEMKRQCDEKKEMLDHILASHKEKGKPRNIKGRSDFSQQLQQAQDAYDDEATLFIFRMKSLKQGRSRSLVTQATRHHAAQLNFFRRGNETLQAVEPHVKLIAEQHCINYQFSGLEDDGSDDDDDYSHEHNNDSELSFEDEQVEHGPQNDSTSQSSMELDQPDKFSALHSKPEIMKEDMEKQQAALLYSKKLPRPGSYYSAPIFPDKKIDLSDKMKELQPSKKFYSYVLPTPTESKTSTLVSSSATLATGLASIREKPTQLWHSSPLQSEKNVRSGPYRDGLVSAPSLSSELSMLKENKKPDKMPPPLSEHLSLPKFSADINPTTKKAKRQAFSGPLPRQALPSRPSFSSPLMEPTMVPMAPTSGLTRRPSLHRVQLGASLPLAPSPKISELHELPRPPVSSARSMKPYRSIGYSAPLGSRSPDDSVARKLPSSSLKASPLPTPPDTITRSFSIPSHSQRTDLLAAPRLSEALNSDITGGVVSPILSPISLVNS